MDTRAGGPAQPGRWTMPEPPAVEAEDALRVRQMARTVDSLHLHLLATGGAPDARVRADALDLLRAAGATVRRSAWSPAAEERARGETGTSDDLRERVAVLERALARDGGGDPRRTASLLGPAVRIGVGVVVGALLAGPLAALVPTTWIPWASEPLKAAIGGGVGAFTAEVTRPIDEWLDRTDPARRPRSPVLVDRPDIDVPDGIVRDGDEIRWWPEDREDGGSWHISLPDGPDDPDRDRER